MAPGWFSWRLRESLFAVLVASGCAHGSSAAMVADGPVRVLFRAEVEQQGEGAPRGSRLTLNEVAGDRSQLLLSVQHSSPDALAEPPPDAAPEVKLLVNLLSRQGSSRSRPRGLQRSGSEIGDEEC